MIFWILEFVIWLVLFFGLLAAIIYLDAKAGMHLTFLGETDIAFVVRGQELHKVLIGLSEEDSETIKKNLEKRKIPWSDRSSSPLAKRLGIHYVSILYPLFRLNEFEILTEGIKDGSAGRELPEQGVFMREWVYHQKKRVKALRWKFPRPFVIEEVELADRTTVDIIVMTILKVEDPYPSVFTFRGDLFETAAPFVESATIDMVVGKSGEALTPEGQEMTYSNFVRIDKGEISEFSNSLRDAINEGGKGEKALVNVLGVRAEKAYIFKYGFSKGQQEAEAASREEAVQRMKAMGTIEKAKGDAQARRINAEAEALRYQMIANSLVEKGITPDVAADVARALVKYENMRESKLSTWVDAEGGLASILGRRGDR